MKQDKADKALVITVVVIGALVVAAIVAMAVVTGEPPCAWFGGASNTMVCE